MLLHEILVVCSFILGVIAIFISAFLHCTDFYSDNEYPFEAIVV